jgi:hypothetical protein
MFANVENLEVNNNIKKVFVDKKIDRFLLF